MGYDWHGTIRRCIRSPFTIICNEILTILVLLMVKNNHKWWYHNWFILNNAFYYFPLLHLKVNYFLFNFKKTNIISQLSIGTSLIIRELESLCKKTVLSTFKYFFLNYGFHTIDNTPTYKIKNTSAIGIFGSCFS